MQGPGLGRGESGGSSDRAVQATNDDATVSKLSCVQHGYFQDNYVRLFVRRPTRRSPVIHRGYFARWAGIRVLLDQFLGPPQPQHQPPADERIAPPSGGATSAQGRLRSREELDRLQIISLGSGFDTLFFLLQEEGRAPGTFIEVDFPEVTLKKASIVSSKLAAALPGFKLAPELSGYRGHGYAVAAADLRDTKELQKVLEAAGACLSAPTLVLAECVLIYMDPSSSDALVAWAGRAFSSAAFVVYEQIRPDDSFGQQMIQNLEARGCPLLGLRRTPSLDSKEERFLRCGFQEAEAVDMDVIYSRCIDQGERQRIEKLEIFDEFEEWHMMQEHYCIAYGIKGPLEGAFKEFGYNIRRRRGST